MYHFAEKAGPDTAPLIYTFHGTGGNEHQFHGFAQDLMPDARVISPRGDVSEQGANRFFKRTGEGVYDMADLSLRKAAMARFMTDHRGAGPVLALGYSNGANILAAVMLDQPEIVERAVLLHPLIPWMPEPQPGLAGRHILITAGARDPICPPDQTETFAAYLTAQGAEVTLHWHPGGHEIAQSEVAAVQGFLR